MGFFTALRKRFEKLDADATKRYEALVLAAARDEDGPKEETAAATIEQAGKSFDDFQADVDRMRERIEWAANVRKSDELQAKAFAAEQCQQKVRAEYETVVKAINAKLEAAESEASVSCAAFISANGDEYRKKLRETAPADRKAAVDEIGREILDCLSRQKRLTEQCSAARRNIAGLRDTIERSQNSSQIHEATQTIRRLEGHVAELEEKLEGEQALRVKLDARQEKAMALLLEP